MFTVCVQNGSISREASSAPVGEHCGAQVRFIGKVRNDARAADLSHLVLEHFPGVTEAEIERIVGVARQRWSLQQARVIHRVGRIEVGEDIVLVETASAHRRDAYEANAFIMDYLKTEAPFWKQECFRDGSSHWVEAKGSDQAAAQRWAAPQSHQRAPRIGALVLAGGEARRMGGVNKGLQMLSGRPLVKHVIDALRNHVDHLAVSANRDLPAYQAFGVPVFPDEPGLTGLGPLAGILSAGPRMPGDLDALLVVPCDTPVLPADLVPRLAHALFTSGGPPAVMAATAEGRQPSIVLMRPAILCTLAIRLHSANPDLSLRGWLDDCGCATVMFEQIDTLDTFININDMAALKALQGRPHC